MLNSKRLTWIVSLLSGFFLLTVLVPGAKTGNLLDNDVYIPAVFRPPSEYWLNIYGSNEMETGQEAFATADGGVILLVEQYVSGIKNALIVKLSAYGSIEWQKIMNDGEWYALNGSPTSDGGLIFSGQSNAVSMADAQVVKMNNNGDIQWQKNYGGPMLDYAESIIETADNGYIFTGYTASNPTAISDLWLVKLDQNGSIQWQKSYATVPATIFHYGTDIQQTSDGGYIVSGYASGGDYAYNLWLLKLDSSGTVTWQKQFGGSQKEYARAVIQTGDGGYIVVGSTESAGAGGSDLLAIKLDSAGNVIWQKSYGGPNNDEAQAIYATNDGRYLIAGSAAFTSADNSDAWLLLIDGNGSVVWQKTYGDLYSDSFNSVQQLADGKLLVGGSTNYLGLNTHDAWVMKLAPDGGNCTLINPSAAAVSNTNFTGQTPLLTTITSAVVPVTTMIPAPDSSVLQMTPVCWW